MKLAALLLLVCALPWGSLADKPRVSHPSVKAMENSLDMQLLRLWPDDPLQIMGLTQGVYISGFGAVFMSEVNLAPGPGITPFHQAITPDEARRLHEKKMARLPQLKAAMQQMLMNTAGSMDSVPDDQQIALGISFFYWHGENLEGLPAQIVMRAPKRVLVDVKTGRADKTALAAALATEEF